MSTEPTRPPDPVALWLIGPGFLIGFLGSLCGIGGGLFAVPLLHFVRRFELKVAVATGLGLVLATTSAATVTELLRDDSQLILSLVAVLAVGVIVGAQIGFLVAERLPVRLLKLVFVVVLAFAGWRVIAGSGAELLGSAASLSKLDHFWAFLVGIGGGFVAPLLGVGGGLVMVPGLYLGIESVGFATARACSLAAGVVAATRSLRLHGKAGRVRWWSAGALGLGALGGAAVGVVATRLDGFAEAGRLILGGLLWFVSARFVVELVQGPSED